MRRLILCLLALAAFRRDVCAAPELTPEQRARVFGPPDTVITSGRVARVRLQGTDRRGFYKCSYLRVSIDGHGPFTFLYDTGASYTSISSEVIRAARLPLEVDRGGYHDLLRISKLRIGEVEIRDLTAVRDDDFGVDGVLGFHAFGDMNLTFDLRERLLLVSSQPVPLPGAFELPYEPNHNIPVIPVMIDTTRVAVLIDTGDDAYAFELRSEDLRGAAFAHEPIAAENVLNGAKTQPTKVTALLSQVRLGPIALEQPVIGINDDLPVADFGVDFLQSFRFEFEPQRMVVAFQPLFSGAMTTTHGALSPGFTLGFDSLGTVANVMPGSAAGRAGMRPGDRILSLDDRAVAAYDPQAWDRLLAPRKPVAVRWRQSTSEHLDRFDVSELR
jgi:predicted aspartyl protease